MRLFEREQQDDILSLGGSRYYSVLLGITRYYSVLLGIPRYYSASLGGEGGG